MAQEKKPDQNATGSAGDKGSDRGVPKADHVPHSGQGARDGGKRTEAEGKPGRDTGSLGVGAEASKGIHDKQAGKGQTPGNDQKSESAGHGSEPLNDSSVHQGSYGGKGGAPRTSSDQREPGKPE